MGEFRGMRLVGERLGKEETLRRLRVNAWHILSMQPGFHKMRKRDVEAAVDKMLVLVFGMRLYLGGKRAGRKPKAARLRSRKGVELSKCLGTARGKCPACDAGRKLKVWPAMAGLRKVMCPGCGWSKMVAPKRGRK